MEPTTLQEATVFFADRENCRKWVLSRRWPHGVECPRCGSKKVTFLERYDRWQCRARHASRGFTIKTGTIFDHSRVGFDRWLVVMWLVVNEGYGITSQKVHLKVGIPESTARYMLQRLRYALTMVRTDNCRAK
jgi:hypothetical protein